MAASADGPQGPAPHDLPLEDKKGLPRGTGLSLKWDNIPEIRHRMRMGYNLLVHYDGKLKATMNADVEKTMPNVKANMHVLQPVCKMVATHGLVVIDDLEHDVKQLFSIYQLVATEKTISKQAWSIRYLIQVLKQSVKGEKDDPTRIKRCPKDSMGCSGNCIPIKFEIYSMVALRNILIVFLDMGVASNPGRTLNPSPSSGCRFAEFALGHGCPGAEGLLEGWLGKLGVVHVVNCSNTVIIFEES